VNDFFFTFHINSISSSKPRSSLISSIDISWQLNLEPWLSSTNSEHSHCSYLITTQQLSSNRLKFLHTLYQVNTPQMPKNHDNRSSTKWESRRPGFQGKPPSSSSFSNYKGVEGWDGKGTLYSPRPLHLELPCLTPAVFGIPQLSVWIAPPASWLGFFCNWVFLPGSLQLFSLSIFLCLISVLYLWDYTYVFILASAISLLSFCI
jgi:hypothetical protein